MTTKSGFAYAQARVQARFARLPAEEEWQRLAAARTLASFLEEARAGPLREWVKGFSGQSDAHDVEAGMRTLFRETVEEVAGWVPRPWRDAVLWTRWLILLPLLDHVVRGGSLPGWTSRDPFLHGLRGEDGALDRERICRSGACALVEASADAATAWKEEWIRRRPPASGKHLSHLDALAKTLDVHIAAFRSASPEAAWGLRAELRARLSLLFHRRMLQPAEPFIFLILTALDLERLRAALLGRALFASGKGGV